MTTRAINVALISCTREDPMFRTIDVARHDGQNSLIRPFIGDVDSKYTSVITPLHDRRHATSANAKSITKRAIAPTPLQVLQTFNTWAFKREQPDSQESVLAQLTVAMAAQRPIRFLLYWGKGPRHEVAEPEQTCLDFLAAMSARVKACYEPGAEFKLICTDTHAELNGHRPEAVDAYFGAVTEAAEKRGFSTCRLGQLLQEHDPQGLHRFDGALGSDPMFERLITCAAKWYDGEGGPEDGAEEYYRMNRRESRVVEIAFPDSIFVTFNGSTFRGLFPKELPIFYMYSLKRGCAVKPWFISQGANDDTAGGA